MVRRRAKDIDRVTVEVELTNAEDLVLVKDGRMQLDQLRRVRTTGLVGKGASHLVLPEDVVKQLGVPEMGKTTVFYADQRRGSRTVVENVRVDLLKRHGNFTAVVEPKRTDVLIGFIVLEDLDLIVDCRSQTLQPRDPKGHTALIE